MKVCLKTERGADAFNLIEVAVCMAVLGIVLISLFASFTSGFASIKISRDELRATQIVNEQLERIRLYNWNQIAKATNFLKPTFDAPLDFTGPAYFAGTVKITNAQYSVSNSFAPISEAYAKDLRTVLVTVTWTNNNSKRTIEARTYISHYGMQIYTP